MMALFKENVQKRNYRIKLLAGKGVILVEADNCESEIFMPHVVNGRLTVLNVIPNRRCCHVKSRRIMNFSINKSSRMAMKLKDQNAQKPLGEFPAQKYSAINAPLANSTPVAVKQQLIRKSVPAQNICSYSSVKDSFGFNFATPEPVRRVIHAGPILFEKSIKNFPTGIKVPSYRNSKDATKNKDLTTPNRNFSVVYNSSNMSMLNSSFRLNSSIIPSNTHNGTARYISLSSPADTIARWQKVLTPVRTYSKKFQKPVMVKRPVSVKKAKKSLERFRVTPTYLANPTQGPNVTQLIEIKKRKLIIDTKLSISPKSFKKQQKQSLMEHKSNQDILQPPNCLSFHKPRLFVDSMSMSAFDMLTNSNRRQTMNKKLNEQFRRRCVNKASSTYSKYKVLCSVPSLQQDEQVLELSRISVQPER